MDKRIEKLRKLMAGRRLDAVLLTGAENIRFFTGFTSADGFVLITDERSLLFADFRYLIQAAEQMEGRAEVVEITRTNAYDVLSQTLAACGVKTVGYEDGDVTMARYTQLKKLPARLRPFSKQLDKQRLLKDKAEISSLRRAQMLADDAYDMLLSRVKAGMTEKEVAAELNYICAGLGSEGASFDPIVGSGPNGAMCHAVPSDRKLQSGDLVVVDFGCIVNGYHSDMTRTFGVGQLDEELVKIYDIVREAQRRALAALKPGITGKALDAVARDYITEEGYGAYFGHGLGHGFGLCIHESPTAAASSEDVLRTGMTVTVEPGIYLPGKGGVRIEDCCVLTRNGHMNLVTTGTDLRII